MHSPARIAVLFLGLVGLAGLWLWASRPAGPSGPVGAPPSSVVERAADLVDAVPSGALLLVTLDVRTLRKTAIGDRLLGRGRRIPGLGLLADVCGQDPLDGVERVAFVVPTEAEEGDFGLIAAGRLDADSLVACAGKVIARRGGRSELVSRGRFRRLRELGAEPATAELAVAPGGPAIVGPAGFIERTIALAEAGAGQPGNQGHAELRALVRPGVAVASVVLTDELRRTLVEELAAQGQEGSPWAASAGAAASLAIDERLRAEVALRCRPADPCLALEREVKEALATRAARFERLLPELGGALRAVQVSAQPGVLRVGLDLMPERAVALVEELLLLSELGRRDDRPPPDDSASPAGTAAPSVGAASAAAPGPTGRPARPPSPPPPAATAPARPTLEW
jgi:hypothetical protein